jgi:hypothetical protein
LESYIKLNQLVLECDTQLASFRLKVRHQNKLPNF